jgi:CRISPR-associated endonuclease Csn1
LLYEECGGICPYTGRTIQFSSLFGGESQFDVEHIIPSSRCPDDSFLNKTLCYHEENRSVKGGQTPWEAYGPDEQRWNEILIRIRSWKPGNPAKLRRFELKSADQIEDCSPAQRYTLHDKTSGLPPTAKARANREPIIAITPWMRS